jgi:LIM domain
MTNPPDHLYTGTPPYSASGSSDSSRDGRSNTPLTPLNQINSPGYSYFGKDKVSRTPSPPSQYQPKGESPSKMALMSIQETAPQVPSKAGGAVFQRLNAGVSGPFSKTGPPRRVAGPGLPSSPASTLPRKNSIDDRSDYDRLTPSPINDTLMALSGRRPSADRGNDRYDTTRRPSADRGNDRYDSKPSGYQPSWDSKPLPNPVSETNSRQDFHRREESSATLGPTIGAESKYVPWWLQDSNQKPLSDETESVRSWDRPLPAVGGQLGRIDETVASRPKTANPDSERSRTVNPFGYDKVADPAIQYGLDDTSKPRKNHFHSNSDPQPKSPGFQKTAFSLDDLRDLSITNPFSSIYSTRNEPHNQHSHQTSQQSFSSTSSHKLAPSTSSQTPSSNASPERKNNWSAAQTQSRQPGSASAGKHTCRGCSHVINGRSLVDASRRLTGRYHKECFTCNDCRAPFPSGEFYVLNNLPYCAFDYHRRNKSLCNGCGIGVEGSYLQTDGEEQKDAPAAKIWHLECFKCSKCSCVLTGEYWELDGKVLCTNDAFPNGFGFGRKNSQDDGRDRLGVLPKPNFGGSSPGGRNPERRRTKLFMGGGGMGLGMSGLGNGMGMGQSGGFGRNMNPLPPMNPPQRRW